MALVGCESDAVREASLSLALPSLSRAVPSGLRRAARPIALRAVFAIVLAASAGVLTAFEWPLADAKASHYFGSSAAGTFSVSMSFASENGLVTAADEGELAFAYDGADDHHGRLPSTIGSYVIVEHPRRIAAVYAELAVGSVSTYLVNVKQGSILGKTGSSGMFKGQGLDFSLFDRGAERWVNPLLLLPPRADKAPPVIRNAVLVKDGKSWPLGETKSLPQGQYAVAVDVVDPLDATWSPGPSAPYFLRLVVDGTKAAEFSFDVASTKDGHLLIGADNPLPYSSFYSADGKTILATHFFARGKTVIQVLARDYAGNERQASWTLSVE